CGRLELLYARAKYSPPRLQAGCLPSQVATLVGGHAHHETPPGATSITVSRRDTRAGPTSGNVGLRRRRDRSLCATSNEQAFTGDVWLRYERPGSSRLRQTRAAPPPDQRSRSLPSSRRISRYSQ